MQKKRIDASDFSLAQWLTAMFSDPDSIFPSNRFPNETAKIQYIKRIKTTSEKKVKDLLRILLPTTGYGQMDIIRYSGLKSSKNNKVKKLINTTEYFRKIAMAEVIYGKA